MSKKIVTTDEAVSKNIAFTAMMILYEAGITVHKNSLEKLRKSLKQDLNLDRTAKQYDEFMKFRVNKKKGQSSTL